MCLERRLAEGAAWAWEFWSELTPAMRRDVTRTVTDWIGNQLIPLHRIYTVVRDLPESLQALQEQVEIYRRNPERLRTEFIESVVPGTRFGELARLLSPGSEPLEGMGEEISRPIILVPGMVGTRLFRTGAAPAPSDEISAFLVRQLQSDDSDLLRGLPSGVRDAVRPALEQWSTRNVYDPNSVWDPDTDIAMVHLMNKTASERGTLFCPDATSAAPATEYSAVATDSMSLRGMFGLLFGRDSERLAGGIAGALGFPTVDNLFEDARFAALMQARKARGWAQPVWRVSEQWLLPLERTFGPVVHVFGYDWRQQLAVSAALLERKIEQVKDANEGKSPILVTHSFGGLVARAAAKARPENVGGIVQVFSPTAGSVEPYLNFKKGGGATVPPSWEEEHPPSSGTLREIIDGAVFTSMMSFDPMDLGFMWLLGWDATSFAATSAGVYGLYSLLPNNIPRFGRSGHWLKVKNDPTLADLLSRSREVYDLYRDFDRPWGLLDGTLWRDGNGLTVGEACQQAWDWLAANSGEAGSMVRFLHTLQDAGYVRVFATEPLSTAQVRTVRERVRTGINHAQLLSANVTTWMHPNTWSLNATGRHTDIGFHIRGTGDAAAPYATHRIVSTEGDGSLEVESARALSSNLAGELQLNDVSHAHAMKESADARAALVKAVYLAMVAAYHADTGH